jgi:transcriptional regulator with XRE-family HTH domain
MSIASRLEQAMKEANFPSQSALSRASGIPQPTINRILKGAGKKGPESQTLVQLAQACEVTFEWLHEGNGPMRRGFAGRGDLGDETGAQRLRGVDGDSLSAEAVRIGRAFDQIKAPEQREALIGVLRAFGVWK